ncbi:hypothetical protein D9758_001473 [Tetrapyrgos nigripes]|uniref:F-box domain-containing protein n=1 Tax=Tetrapyrgos nigripes TaxID=182062 RepID=A0A8H5GX08_9AGAR|nr:hypothetical protein D9758_001473 [Tetrapyrgos nigripes]
MRFDTGRQKIVEQTVIVLAETKTDDSQQMARSSARVKEKVEINPSAPSDPGVASSSNATTMIPSRKRARVRSEEVDSTLGTHEDEDGSEVVDNDVVVSEDEEFDVPKSLKRKRDGAKQTKGKGKSTGLVAADPKFKKVRGKLGILHKVATEMPLDVIFEIFMYLEPLDILSLSRTSKDLRNLLTSKSSEYIWRAARENAEDLPPPPSDMNEMQYANIVRLAIPSSHSSLDAEHHLSLKVCNYHSCDNVFWAIKMRACKKCLGQTTLLLTSEQICDMHASDYIRDSTKINSLLDLVPCISLRTRGNRNVWYLASAYRQRYTEFKAIQPELQGNLSRWMDWYRSKLAENNERIQANKPYEIWLGERENDRGDKIAERRNQRKKDIEDRLIALGWGREVEELKKQQAYSYIRHKQFGTATKLTEGGWQKIAPDFLKLMQDTRDDRLRVERAAVLRKRHLALQRLYKDYIANNASEQTSTIFPPFGDIMFSKIFDPVLWDTPLDTIVTDDDFADGFTKIPAFVEEWNKKTTQELLELVQKSEPSATVDTLSHVTTVFTCLECVGVKTPLGYQQVLSHPCFSTLRSKSFLPRNDPYDAYSNLMQFPWNQALSDVYKVRYSAQSSDRVKAILQACGLQASDTTLDTLDNLNPLLECKTCANPLYGRYFLRWRKALAHQSVDNSSHEFYVDSFADIQDKVLEVEKPPVIMESYWKKAFICNQCTPPEETQEPNSMTFTTLKAHLLSIHGIQNDQVTEDHWSWNPDTPLYQRVSEPFRVKLEEEIASGSSGDAAADGPTKTTTEGLSSQQMARSSARLKEKAEINPSAPSDPGVASSSNATTMIPSRKRARVRSEEVDSTLGTREDEDGLEVVDDDVEVSEDEEFEAPKSLKRKRHGAKQTKGKGKSTGLVATDPKFKKVRGTLGLLHKVATDMPLDVIFEIFMYLEPLDILSLSRTNKDLRNLLTPKSSGYIWKAAGENIEDLPPPPSDMNEVQYASLMFDRYCQVGVSFLFHSSLDTEHHLSSQVCNYHSCNNVFWSIRLRACKKCLGQTTLLLTSEQVRNIYASDYIRDSTKMSSLFDLVPYLFLRTRGRRSVWYLASAIRQRYTEFKAIQPELQGDPSRWFDWHASKRAENNERVKANKPYEIWLGERENDRGDKIAERRNQRKKDIEDRLIALGWGREVEELKKQRAFSYIHHKQFGTATKLTQGGWQKIAPDFLKLVQDTRDNRLRAERTAVLRTRHLALQRLYNDYIAKNASEQTSATFPPFGDIMFSKIFEPVLWDTPLDTIVTDDDSSDGFTKIPTFVEEWNKKTTQELLELVQKSDPSATVDTLSRVTTVFTCPGWCRVKTPLGYPQVLSHPCFSTRCNNSFSPRNDPYDAYSDLMQFPWNQALSVGYKMRYSAQSSDRVKAILQACGLQASDTTLDTLDKLNPLLECKTCASPLYGRYFLRWRKALAHQSVDNSSHEFSVDSFADIQDKVLEVEKRPTIMESYWRDVFICSQCATPETQKPHSMTFTTLKAHLLSIHGIQNDQVTEDHWSWNPDTPLYQRVSEPFRVKLEEEAASGSGGYTATDGLAATEGVVGGEAAS